MSGALGSLPPPAPPVRALGLSGHLWDMRGSPWTAQAWLCQASSRPPQGSPEQWGETLQPVPAGRVGSGLILGRSEWGAAGLEPRRWPGSQAPRTPCPQAWLQALRAREGGRPRPGRVADSINLVVQTRQHHLCRLEWPDQRGLCGGLMWPERSVIRSKTTVGHGRGPVWPSGLTAY